MINSFIKRLGSTQLAVGCFLVIPIGLWSAQVLRSGWCNDESAHIPAGVYHILTGRMDAYRVNPPLPRLIAALPLLLNRPQLEWSYSESPYVRNEFQFASDWLDNDAVEVRRQLVISRIPMLVFFLLGLGCIACWAREMYGTQAAWLAGTLWSLNPDVLTNAAVVAPDLPAAATGLLVGYRYWAWLIATSRHFPWGVAACLALAISCKFTWLFLLALLPLSTLAYDIWTQRKPIRNVARDAMCLLGSFLLTCVLINWLYGFEGTGTRLGDYKFISADLAGNALIIQETGNRFVGQYLADVPLPLPREMVRGLDYLKWEFEQGQASYLNGQWQARGWWHFYLLAIAMKMPLGYWILIGIGLISMVTVRTSPKTRVDGEWVAIVFAVAMMLMVSSQTGFTHHVRYVLPVYGFLFMIASRAALVFSSRCAAVLAIMCLSGTMLFHSAHLGMSHTFFNPLVGGPNQGWRHLGFSNVDWGQSTYRMLNWIERNPQVRPLAVQFAPTPVNSTLLVEEMPGVSIDDLEIFAGEEERHYRYLMLSSAAMTLDQNRRLWQIEPWVRPYADVLVFKFNDVPAENEESEASF